MLLEDPIIREVQIIRPKALEPILNSPSSKPAPVVPLQQKMSKVKAQPRAYPGPTPTLNALNIKVMGTWRSSIQVNPELFF